MAPPLSLRGKWVLVTGASSGLGREMARLLARVHGAHLVLVARRQERLEALCAELTQAHGIQAMPLVADLSRPEAVARVLEGATQGRTLGAAVLNAGVTYYGEALAQAPAEQEALLATNVTSVAGLATGVARHMLAAGEKGALLLISSVAGFMPMPLQAVYGGSKAFITSFGQALGEELRPKGLSVTVFAPGGIATELLEVSGLGEKFKAGQTGVMAADACAAEALAALLSRRPLAVPGALNQSLALAARVLPRGFLTARVASLYKKGE